MSTRVKTQPLKLFTVKQAVAKAMAAAGEFYAKQDMVDLTLEEVEMSDDGKHWLITLGFFLASKKPPTDLGDRLRQIQGKTYERRYKLFKVDVYTGKVGSMKIRNV